jgi:UDP-N-acetylmuramate: L-alanyl-gamma-D-glutamyl-meso-diaminopimelate ligase
VEKLYFIRVGGTAMGGVAAACQALGDEVSGSEESLYEPMKSYLAEAGVTVIPSFDPGNIERANPDRIVVGNAVSRGNPELEAAMDQRRTLVSLSQLVSERLIAKNTSVVVTGTHGKTTTTSMAAWFLEQGGRAPGFLIGGVPGNFEVSCRPAQAENGTFIIEGDEYDTAFFDKRSKFLWYRPDVAIINNLEHDHADIFPDLESVKASFRLFLRLIPSNGLLLYPHGDANVLDVVSSFEFAPKQSFGLDEGAEWRATELEGNAFTVEFRGSNLARLHSTAPGEHNVRNMLAAFAAAHHLGVQPAQLERAAQTFRLPKRRMEELGEWRGALVVDDFAHHPTAIRETIRATQAKYPGRRILMVFEPRSNSTTRNLFEEEFKTCFDGAAGVFFGALDRPWRYQPKERLDTDGLVRHYHHKGVQAASVTIEQGQEPDWGKYAVSALERWVQPGDVILIGSNGDVGGLRSMLVGPQ